MRKITKNARAAFIAGREFKLNNTTVSIVGYEDVSMKLYGHEIAYTLRNKLYITNAGYPTNTTKERLNGLPNVQIQQKKGNLYLNGNLWDGKTICVDTLNK